MNKADKVKIIDTHITAWTFEYRYGKCPSLSSCDEALSFLKSEAAYWKKLEDDFPAGVLRFSECYDKCRVNIEEAIKLISDEHTSAQSIYNLINARFDNKETIKLSLSGSSFMLHGRQLLCSVNSDSEATSYAYKYLYAGDNKIYDAFVGIVYEPQHTLGSYLSSNNDSYKKAAICYIGLQWNKHKYPSRNAVNQEKIKDVDTQLAIIAKDLDEKRADINEFLDDCRMKFDKQFADRNADFDGYRKEINDWHIESNAKFKALEATYEGKLQLSAPVKHWEDEADKKERSFKKWLGVTITMCIILLVIASVLVSYIFKQAEKVINADGTPLYYLHQYFIFVAIITFLVYIIRILVKITMSEKHMQAEYSQKAAFTYFYLSLLQKSDNVITKEERPIILANLFSRVDTGLIKSDEKSDSDIEIVAALSQLGKN
jgi:hypothetical protein